MFQLLGKLGGFCGYLDFVVFVGPSLNEPDLFHSVDLEPQGEVDPHATISAVLG